MLEEYRTIAQGMALLLASWLGWFHATVPADWRQDEFSASGKFSATALADLIDGFHFTGLLKLLLAPMLDMRRYCLLYGKLPLFLYLCTFSFALVGWPVTLEIDRFFHPVSLVLLLLERALWMPFLGWLAGYVLSRLLFRDAWLNDI